MKAFFHDRSSITAANAHIYSVAARYDIADLEIIKIRRDSKIIAKGHHADWGAVAVKSVDPIANPGRAYSGRAIDHLVLDSRSTIFPKIHDVGMGYSVCKWVEGGDISRLSPGALAGIPLIQFADAVGAWGKSSSNGEILTAEEIKSIIRFYIQVTIRRMLYRSASRCVSSCANFVLRKNEIGGYVDTMANLAPGLTLERSLMLSDLHIENLVYDRDSDSLVVVDFEAMRPGNTVFDAVFFLAFLILKRSPPQVTQKLAEHIFSYEYIPCDNARHFFQAMVKYIVATYMIIDGHPRRTIEAGLDIISNSPNHRGDCA